MDQERIRKLRELYARVETRLKNIEYNADGNLTIPCVNQLRYAGNHLLEYLISSEESQLSEAEGHCSRALFDAYEVEALYYLKTFKRFQDEYEDEPINDCVSQYLEWCAVAEEVQDFVRTHSQSDGRGAYYEQFDPYVVKLQVIPKFLPYAREALNKKRDRSKRDRWWAIGGVALSIVALVVTVFFGIEPDLGKEIWSRISTPRVSSAREPSATQDQSATAKQRTP